MYTGRSRPTLSGSAGTWIRGGRAGERDGGGGSPHKKVVEAKTLVIRNVEPYRGGRFGLFLQLVTDEGIVGLGERPSNDTERLDPQVHRIQELARQFVIGRDPFDVELLWQRMYAARHDHRHPGLDLTPAISAIEMACWDIVGKAVSQPVYKLLGGRFHNRLSLEVDLGLPPGTWRSGWCPSSSATGVQGLARIDAGLRQPLPHRPLEGRQVQHPRVPLG